MRTSWTDPRATYVIHRTGPASAHYHDDQGEILLAAKGAPLAWDFGNQYAPLRREEPWYHNKVSFDKPGATRYGGTGKLEETVFLPRTADYSYGVTTGGGGQQDRRHVLLVKSDYPLGANYVLVRDATVDGQPNQKFYFNLFCLGKQPEIAPGGGAFPGAVRGGPRRASALPRGGAGGAGSVGVEVQHGDLGGVRGEMYGLRAEKTGSTEDFLTLLYPRAAGQAAAQGGAGGGRLGEGDAADGRAGDDDQAARRGGAGGAYGRHGPAAAGAEGGGGAGDRERGGAGVLGEVAFARRYEDGKLRLAVLKGSPAVALGGGWTLASTGAAGVEIRDGALRGETSGEAHEVILGLPEGWTQVAVTLDGKTVAAARNEQELRLKVPAGYHTFVVEKR